MGAKYVLAVILSEDLKNVWLMRKKRSPRDAAQSMAGKLNFPGGHVEEGETSLEAIRRELFEECAYEGTFLPFCAITGEHGESRGYNWVPPRSDPEKVETTCLCFWSRASENDSPVSLTDEEVLSIPLESLHSQYAVDDVGYLSFIALGLAKAQEMCPGCMDLPGVDPSGCTEDREACNKPFRMS